MASAVLCYVEYGRMKRQHMYRNGSEPLKDFLTVDLTDVFLVLHFLSIMRLSPFCVI